MFIRGRGSIGWIPAESILALYVMATQNKGHIQKKAVSKTGLESKQDLANNRETLTKAWRKEQAQLPIDVKYAIVSDLNRLSEQIKQYKRVC